MTGPAGGPVTEERSGRPYRHFPVAVSAGAMALAWARQEGGAHGATVLVDHEITALGRLGQPWQTPPEATLACAVILRPTLAPDDADVAWLVGALGAAGGIESATGTAVATWWPDTVVDAGTGRRLGAVHAEIHMGPGRIRAAVMTVRLDLAGLGLNRSQSDDLLTAVVDALDQACESLEEEGTAGAAAAYERRCALIGKRLKVRLRPTGETRGEASAVDSRGWLQLTSATGMVERITVDMLRDLEVL
ncbi:MAG: hypothetical protein M3N98_07250 [Actinomycetota bacterium]|nr:hypothetical protein [Actinomycetota bacterium]